MQYIYITSNEWFETTSLKNPICGLDHNLDKIYPEYYSVDYDLKIVATKPATPQEKAFTGYNDYREKYGQIDISAIDDAVGNSTAKKVYLNGFNQNHFEYIAPLIKDKTEILYLFKCNKVRNLSALSEFRKLKCVFMYGNSALERLWNMHQNDELKILSFVYVTKLQYIDTLVDSHCEYFSYDGSDNFGNKREILFDKSVLQRIETLKHLYLI